MTEFTGELLKEIYKEIPIPELPSVAGWKDIPISECGEKLVPVGLFTEHCRIITDAIYFGWSNASPYVSGELDGATLSVFVREGVARKLDGVSRMLPKNTKLIIFDGFRPLEVQRSLYIQYYEQLKEKYADWSEEKLSLETQRFVSLPSTDFTRPSPHNTGGAVDLGLVEISESEVGEISRLEKTIVQETDGNWRFAWEISRLSRIKQLGHLLNFGTNFDYGGEKTSLAYFEQLKKKRTLSAEEKEALKNRRWLYWLMKTAGFEAYPDEWWHFNDRQTQMGVKCAGSGNATYSRIDMTKSNLNFDRMVQESFRGLGILQRIFEGNQTAYFEHHRFLVWPAALLAINWDVFPQAERIRPE